MGYGVGFWIWVRVKVSFNIVFGCPQCKGEHRYFSCILLLTVGQGKWVGVMLQLKRPDLGAANEAFYGSFGRTLLILPRA